MATAAVQLPIQPDLGALKESTQVQVTERSARDTSNEKHNVRAVLNYFKDPTDGSAPHPAYVDRPESYKRETEAHEVTIHDVRGDEDKYTLDGNGFQIHRQHSTEKDFVDDEQIKASYYPEIQELLKSVTGASRVFIFDHTIRRNPPVPRFQPAPNADQAALTRTLRGPVQQVHIDQSYTASLNRVSHHLPSEADVLLAGRVQIINVWRPIRTIQRDPLAIAEASSVSESELVPIGLIYPDRRGETFGVRHAPGQKWFYKSRLSPEEVILIKCFDSKTDGRARRVPHTAFVDPDAPADAPTRESIEVRCLVFHPDDRD